MADISNRITKKSYAAKKKAAIKTLKAQTKEKIKELELLYAENPEEIQARLDEKEKKRILKIQKENGRTAYNARQPRRYSLGEDIFNSISHGIGAGLGVAALVLLIIRAFTHFTSDKALMVSGYSIFGATLFITYMMSTLFHALSPLTARKVFSILDYDSAFLLLGGTCTPLIFAYFGAKFVVPLVILWSIIAALITLYSIFDVKARTWAVLSFLVLGWAATIFFYKYGAGNYQINRILLLVGSISYTVGGFFAGYSRIRGFHCVYHLCSMAGSILHFFAIYGMN